jgi:DNA-binding response OmpR family regulator
MHENFENKGWLCEDFIDANEVLDAAKKRAYDLYIIDVNLNESNGITLLKELRKKQPQVPAIMVSGYNDIETIMDAYEAGCDEYLKKPFDLRELELKISKLMSGKLLDLSDGVKYDLAGHTLLIDEKAVHLSQKESNLLHTFMTNVNRQLSHEYLESVIWGSVEENGHALRNLILRLRKRIGNGIIETVQGKGYILRLNTEQS